MKQTDGGAPPESEIAFPLAETVFLYSAVGRWMG